MLEGNLKTKKKYKVRIDFPHRIFFIFRALSTVNDLNMNCDWKISQILWRKIMTFSQNSTSALCWDEVEWDKKNLYEVLERQHRMRWFIETKQISRNRERKKNFQRHFLALTGISECLMRTKKEQKANRASNFQFLTQSANFQQIFL